MVKIERTLTGVARGHLARERQMLFLTGPRQVGKTTCARMALGGHRERAYLSGDNADDRELLLQGPTALATRLGLDRLRDEPVACALDELHKYARWKDLLKGFFDTYERQVRLVVTGSARLDVFRSGGDSLMGRYFPYRLHPLSVAELVDPAPPEAAAPRPPRALDDEAFDALERFGGFPEPFVRGEQRFWNRWRRLRTEQLLREDLRDLTRIQEVAQVEVLAEVLRRQAGGLVSLTSLANAVAVSIDTVRRWIGTLEALYYCFSIRPWIRNVTRSLRKEPKLYLWDWSLVDDPGARAENQVAAALLKATQLWTDLGFGTFALHFLRDKEQREVDFLVSRDDQPWFLVEVKRTGGAPLSPHLARFQSQTGAPHAFQVAWDLPFVARDAFELTTPVIVPARTFLSQLV